VLGYEVAGVIAGTEERVFASTHFGGYAERVVVPRADALPIPAGLSFAQASALPVSCATAWAALTTCANVRAGERVLVLAAAGGVGLAAVQIARTLDAYVIGVCSPAKHAAVLEHGADEARDYDDRAIPPVDVVLDALGGTSLRRSYRLLRSGGRLVAYGASNLVVDGRRSLRAVRHALAMVRGFNLISLIDDSKSVIGLNMPRLWEQAGSLRPWLLPVCDLVAEGRLAPVIDQEVPLEQAATAHRRLGSRQNVGKIVLTVEPAR
jgi:NADPH:quinone reductase-like Zn-dependent oxidoreductase